MTQAKLAAALGVNQGEVSKIEHRTDIYLSTLAGYVEALGGKLEIRAVFPRPRNADYTIRRASIGAGSTAPYSEWFTSSSLLLDMSCVPAGAFHVTAMPGVLRETFDQQEPRRAVALRSMQSIDIQPVGKRGQVHLAVGTVGGTYLAKSKLSAVVAVLLHNSSSVLHRNARSVPRTISTHASSWYGMAAQRIPSLLSVRRDRKESAWHPLIAHHALEGLVLNFW